MTSDNSYLIEGGPAGVLLIHGLGGTPVEMKHVGKGLARAGFTVYGMQLAGHCGTEADLLATGWRDWYASVEEAHTRLSQRCQTVFVAGLSMGAALALYLAAHRPGGVAGVGLYSITLKYDGWSVPKLSFLLPFVLRLPWGRNYCFYEAYPYGIKDERLRQVVVRKLNEGGSVDAGLLRTPGVSLREFWRFAAELKRKLPAIRTPALVMHATEDDIAGVRSNAGYLQDHLGGPVELVLLDDSYHIITVDRQRQEVVRQSVRFFNSLLPQPATVAGGPPATREPTDQASAPPTATQAPEVRCLESIAAIDCDGWNRCFPGEIELFDYYLAAEEAGIPEFRLRYLTVAAGDKLLAVAAAFVVDYRLDTTLDGFWKRVSNRLYRWFPRLMTARLACLGSPVSDVCHVGFAPGVSGADRLLLFGRLLDGLDALARQEHIGLTGLKDVPELQADLWSICRGRGFRPMHGLPTAVVALPHGSLDAYLATLSPHTRQAVDRKMRNASAVRCERRTDISDVLPQVMALYEEALARSERPFERLPGGYFQGILQRLPDRASCFLYWVGNRLVAFNLVLANNQVLVDKLSAVHYPAARPYNLHFLRWMTNVRHAMACGIASYQSDYAGYAPKLRLGSTSIPNWIFFRHRNLLVNTTLRLISRLVGVDRQQRRQHQQDPEPSPDKRAQT